MTSEKFIIHSFGCEKETITSSDELLYEVFEEAHNRARTANKPDIECILDIMDKVSEIWFDENSLIRSKVSETLIKDSCFSNSKISELCENIGNLCSANALIKRIQNELSSDILFSKDKDTENNCRLIAKPHGVVFHFTCHNALIDPIENWIAGIITKNVNIIKIDSFNKSILTIFLESLMLADSEGVIWLNQALIYCEDDDKLLNIISSYNNLTILFSGEINNFITLKEKNRNNRLIDNCKRYSFAVIEGKCVKPNSLSDVVERLALDICSCDFQFNLVPRIVYVVDKDLKSSHLLIEALFDELIQLSEDFPNNRLSFSEKYEIRKLREVARMMQVKGEGRLVCPEDFSFTLILEYNSSIRISCLNRILFIKRVTTIEDIAKQMSPYINYLNSVGLVCSSDVRQTFENELITLGIKRITSLGHMYPKPHGISQQGILLLSQLVDYISIEY